jgi:hypothetical protein
VARREGERLPAALLETVARAIHEGYRRDQAERKPEDDPAMAPWEGLPESLRESNRAQAGQIFEKLRAIGCDVQEAVGEHPAPFVFAEPEVELLSELEHERWVAERRSDGWTAGSERDVDRKVTPYLVGWDDLPEDVREWDRESVRRIPEVLARVGLEIRRLR